MGRIIIFRSVDLWICDGKTVVNISRESRTNASNHIVVIESELKAPVRGPWSGGPGVRGPRATAEIRCLIEIQIRAGSESERAIKRKETGPFDIRY